MPLPDANKTPSFAVKELHWHILNDETIPADLLKRLASEGLNAVALSTQLRSEDLQNAECKLAP